MKPQVLSVDLPRIDGDTQSRVAINEDVVADYAEVIEQAGTEWPFPPIDVFHDGTEYFVADGFHRLLAAHRAKRGSIPCNVHQGTAKDARIFGMTANDKHGLRMTREDKRACVEFLLEYGGKMTQKMIAEKAGVGIRTVQAVVADRKPASLSGKQTPQKSYANPQLAGCANAIGDSGAPQKTKNAQVALRSAGGEPSEPEQDLGKCPNCLGEKWTPDELGLACAKCHHPWGEPAGEVDSDNITTQRQKTVKTAEALMRAFDDLNHLCAKPWIGECIAACKDPILKRAKAWK